MYKDSAMFNNLAILKDTKLNAEASSIADLDMIYSYIYKGSLRYQNAIPSYTDIVELFISVIHFTGH